MLKKNIALMLTLNIICVIACGLQVNADDNMIWTDSFDITNQPSAQAYTSSLFNGIITSFSANYLATVSVVEDTDSNAVFKFTRNAANSNTQTEYLKSIPFDLSGGKELIFKEKFKVSNGNAIYKLGMISTSTAAWNANKEGFLTLSTGGEKIYVGSDAAAAGYFANFRGTSVNTWFTYEARLKIDLNGYYTVDNYVFNSDGTLFFHPTEYASTTALTSAEIADLQIRTGVYRGYNPGPFELCIDDCSVIVYQGGESGGLVFSSPANQSTVVRLDSDVLMTFTDLLGDNVSCTVFKDGKLLDESLYSIEKTAFSLKLIFNSDLVKSSSYKIVVADADGEKGSFSFETEKAHKIEMSLDEINLYDAEAEEFVPLTEITPGRIQAKLLINDPLKYSLLSGIVTPVLYREGKMIWIGNTDFSEELADGDAQLTAEFDLPAGADGDELKFLLFDSDLSWMPLNEGVEWLQE